MARKKYVKWCGAFRAATKGLLEYGEDELERFWAEQLLRQYEEGCDAPDHDAIKRAWRERQNTQEVEA